MATHDLLLAIACCILRCLFFMECDRLLAAILWLGCSRELLCGMLCVKTQKACRLPQNRSDRDRSSFPVSHEQT
ncbi:MAG: hypothetical protein RMY34_02360 [Aulosira sp. DedQUE10]|nr:hypothetical protein [Aulosira sp. DedQUE10]